MGLFFLVMHTSLQAVPAPAPVTFSLLTSHSLSVLRSSFSILHLHLLSDPCRSAPSLVTEQTSSLSGISLSSRHLLLFCRLHSLAQDPSRFTSHFSPRSPLPLTKGNLRMPQTFSSREEAKPSQVRQAPLTHISPVQIDFAPIPAPSHSNKSVEWRILF